MAFDQKTRNLLQRTVAACRSVLDAEFTAQLQEVYGIQPDGVITPMEALAHLGDEDVEIAALLRDRINYLEAAPADEAKTRTRAKPENVRRLIREQAFTVLNRLAALRLAEERGLVQECVRRGNESDGFKLFQTSAGGALGDTFETYRIYLECLFEELALDLGVLFDRFNPMGLLFPRRDALDAVLKELNGTGTAAEREEISPEQFAVMWQADETIGWIYQYYNDPTERKKMREESAAPRNSRELAVRNQFFTPRYVVEFLTDNTLGRIWYEMCGGRTALKESCRYLVRRPAEVFLAGPAEVYRQLFKGDAVSEDMQPHGWVAAAFAGQLQNLPEKASDPDTRWVGAAIRPVDFENLAGEPCPAFEEHCLSRLSSAIIDGRATADTENLVLVWAALSDFIRCDGSRGYSAPHWEKVWKHFCKLAQRPASENLSQAELLKQPVFIPHRPIKDPRTILMLDPACGSMHFGLYAFDLFEVIYHEAWELEENCGADILIRLPGMKSLRETFATKEEFLRQVPRLIIEHNIHGIDIDPRCAQIAGLSLWLRAQKSWQRLGLKPAERPAIKRSNIVCAEPMPGEKELLREFVEREFVAEERGLFLQLLEAIFDKMQLAGEAGSLLKIEEEIRSAIAEAKQRWKAEPKAKQSILFPETGELEQKEIKLDLSGITDEQFWGRMEERIYAALRDYAEQAENGGGFQRRLFADDAARGFAFIDVCRKRYDVAVMNPPFGEVSDRIRPLLEQFVSFTDNIAAPFGERFLSRSDFVAMVLDRALLIRKTHEAFRRLFLAKGANRLRGFANYGWGVLDANVEVAGVVASSTTVDATYLLAKEADAKTIKWIPSNGFSALPNLVISDEVPDFVLSAFAALPALGDFSGCARVGHQWKSERFLRLWWEGNAQSGPFVYNGAPFSPYVFITRNRMACDPNAAEVAPEPSTVLRNQSFHYLPGVAYGKRGIHLDAHFLPAAQTFTVEGLACFPDSISERLVLLAYLNSLPVSGLLQFFCGQHKHVGYVNCLPFSQKWKLSQHTEANLLRFLNLKRSLLLADETSPIFGAPFVNGKRSAGIAADWNSLAKSLEALSLDFSKVHNEVGAEVAGWLGFPPGWENNPVFKETMNSIPLPDATDIFDEADFQNEPAHCARMIGIWVGHSFGRWDIRYATGEKAAPELPDSFAPLPVCPPGMLQNSEGLPARPKDVSAKYPVTIQWDGIIADDPDHPVDIERCIREVIAVIWPGTAGGPTAESIEQEACEILGVDSLRDYFRRPAGFFADHLKRYSKSRRQAPIYWPLSTASGSYTLWIYYHRLDDQTLYKCIQQFVDPKLADVEKNITHLRSVINADEGGGKERRSLEELEDLRRELKDFRAELERWAGKWKPNLNDGVVITACPLWKLFALPKWRKDLEACWRELEAGDYDWAHLAQTLWPDRVRKKCESDRSLAIAHGLEELCEVKAPEKKAKKAKKEKAKAEAEFQMES